jgi:geranylgeranyl reductase family protein
MPPHSDVLIVGAGPAGSLAALMLARAGVSVHLLDRARFPRPKLCGDTLNPGSLAILDRHELGAPVRARSIPVSGMTVTGPGRVTVSADYPAGVCGAAITRHVLDARLVEAAVSAGARFEPDVTVLEALTSPDGRRVIGVRTAAGTRRASLVIAADGRGSRLGASLGLTRFARTPRRWAFGAYFEGVEGMTRRGEMHIRAAGYVGVAPLPDGITNVCVVRERTPQDRTFDSRTLIRDVTSADPMLRDRFGRASQVSEVAVLGPLAMEADASGIPGLLLAGDAAGFVDPMTGDGLRFALRGAELAVEAALDELSTGLPAFRSLAAARAREFSAKWRINRALRSLVGSPRGVRIAAGVSRYWPAPVEYLVGVAGDLVT